MAWTTTRRVTELTQAPPQSESEAQKKARTRKDKALVAAITALLTAGAVGFGLMVGIRSALIAWGLPIEIASWLADMASTETKPPDLGLGPIGPMQKAEHRQAYAWRAIYVWSAAERLLAAKDLAHAEKVERGYFYRHVAAEERRDRAAALVDITSKLLGDRTEEQTIEHIPLLGWRAVIDNRTTPECKWANGRNFRADSIPIIGIPGSVHFRCRCSAGPALKGAPLIPSA